MPIGKTINGLAKDRAGAWTADYVRVQFAAHRVENLPTATSRDVENPAVSVARAATPRAAKGTARHARRKAATTVVQGVPPPVVSLSAPSEPPVVAQPTEPPVTAQHPSDEGVRLERLKTLASLRDSGALTEEEFLIEKRRILEGH